MMKNLSALINAELDGQIVTTSYYKNPTSATAVGNWFDLSMSPGTPTPNYYATTPLTSTQFGQNESNGLYVGQAISPKTRGIRQIGMTVKNTGSPRGTPFILCDYLMYYSFCDMGLSDWQYMNNTTTLPRYDFGQVIAVCVGSPSGVGNPRFQIKYTNQDGVSGRISPIIATGTQSSVGTILNAASNAINTSAQAAGPFLPLQNGDFGVRSIEAIQFLDSDYGLVSLCIVKPICSASIINNYAIEKDFLIQAGGEVPIVKDDAYLNFIFFCNDNSFASNPILGYINFVFN